MAKSKSWTDMYSFSKERNEAFLIVLPCKRKPKVETEI